MLIHEYEFFELDGLADAVWLCCDGTASVVEIVHQIAAVRELSLGEALAATAIIILRLGAAGLIGLEKGQVPVRGGAAPSTEA